MPKGKKRSAGPVADLASLGDNVSAEDVTSALAACYAQSLLYTRIGHTMLVGLAPTHSSPQLAEMTSEAVREAWYKDYKNIRADTAVPAAKPDNKPPHAFEVANSLYYHLRRTGVDQSAVFRGESGSGKTLQANLVLQQLCAISGTSKKDKRIHNRIQAAQTVLNAFGNAKTEFSYDSSRYGSYLELQFSARGKMTGCKQITYNLERDRVVTQKPQERSFHAFYYLLDGAAPSLRQELGITEHAQFPYLNYGHLRVHGIDDSGRFEHLKDALKTIGLGKRSQHSIFRMLSAILHLGLIQFGNDHYHHSQASSHVVNRDVLEFVASLLELDPSHLEQTLINRTRIVNKDRVTQLLSPEQASEHRDNLAKSLYSVLFAWLVEYINSRLCTDDEDMANFIGLVDFSGYQPYKAQGFNQFVNNYMSERLHRFVTCRVFEYGNKELRDEGMVLPLSPPAAANERNDACVDLLNNHDSGIVSLLQKHCHNALVSSSPSNGTLKNRKKNNASAAGDYADDVDNDTSGGNYASTDVAFTKEVCALHADNQCFVPPKSASMASTIFGVKHFAGAAVYAAQGFTEKNLDVLSTEFVLLFRGGNGSPGSGSDFIQTLFSESLIAGDTDTRNAKTVIGGHTLSRRQPSIKRARRGDNVGDSTTLTRSSPSSYASATVLSNVVDALDSLLDALEGTQSRFVLCLKPNESPVAATNFESKKVKSQVRTLAIADYASFVASRGGDYTVRYQFADFVVKYAPVLDRLSVVDPAMPDRTKCEAIATAKNWSPQEMFIGRTLVVLRDDIWRYLENYLRKLEQSSKRQDKRGGGAAGLRNSGAIPLAKDRPKYNPNAEARTEYSYDGMESVYSESEFTEDDRQSDFDRDSFFGDGYTASRSGGSDNGGGGGKNARDDEDDDNFSVPDKAAIAMRNLKIQNRINGSQEGGDNDSMKDMEYDEGQVEELEVTPQRRRWIFFTWLLTWWVPTFALKWCGGMKRDDVRMAWREKLAIFLLILFCCAVQLFLIAGLGAILCPHQNLVSLDRLSFMKGGTGTSGRVDTATVAIYGALYHLDKFTKVYHSQEALQAFAGQDITAGFPRTPAYYCTFAAQNTPNFPNLFKIDGTDNGTYIQQRHADFYQRNLYNAELWIDQRLKSDIVGNVGWDPKRVNALGVTKRIYMIKGRVYNLQPMYDAANGGQTFLPPDVEQLLLPHAGQDMTTNTAFMAIWNTRRDLRDCFNNLFIVGLVDLTASVSCQLTNYLLLAFSVVLVAIIGIKFLAALQLTGRTAPEEHDKFVIMQVPCYTEGEDSLRKCIESLATLSYDDKRKLLFIICDGNIMGSGNDKPTPRIVLDILGVDNTVDPEPLSFQSIGEGMKQHNMGKVYSGLYEVSGHLVPYVVVVKVGRPKESNRPGNRGKRDSQMILMRFLNKVYFDAPMSPLELEMYHQIKNVIGVDPSFYEYCLMVDADTNVFPDSLTRLVTVMMHDTKVMGVCGETRLQNEKDTWATMIQVYEYYISHHLAKAFESLFGSVTCLPGCFCMYRLRTPGKNSPLLVANSIIKDYGDVNVDTLHKKNLLSLGEDRFLTTLMLKHFPHMRTVFTADAQCSTLAPENWNVLLSQRRRWINSTIHNLVELLDIPQLCGFCFFSMRFVVFIDLIATLIQPAIVGYLAYLIYMVVIALTGSTDSPLPVLSLILLGVIYGLQAIIFLIKREWQHVGWMIIYLLAIPVFSLFIPVYSFWHMDDFSWGNTRIVVGERGRKQVYTAEEEKFDIRQIPHRRWSEYEAEMFEVGSHHSAESGSSRQSDARSVRSSYSHGSAALGMPLGGGGGYASSAYGGGANGDMGDFGMMSSSPPHPHTQSLYGGSVMNKRVSALSGTVAPPSEYTNNVGGGGGAGLHRSPSIGTSYTNRTGGGGAPGYPTDEEIYMETRRILSTANLMTITKKQVRTELSALFNMDLTHKKDYINNCINEILASV
ncbi:hypothetical protein RI367_004430 [Sorochytrium milnesiophthora]